MTASPSSSGIIRSRTTSRGVLLVDQAQRRPPVARGDHRVALPLEVRPDERDDLRVVVDDEDGAGVGGMNAIIAGASLPGNGDATDDRRGGRVVSRRRTLDGVGVGGAAPASSASGARRPPHTGIWASGSCFWTSSRFTRTTSRAASSASRRAGRSSRSVTGTKRWCRVSAANGCDAGCRCRLPVTRNGPTSRRTGSAIVRVAADRVALVPVDLDQDELPPLDLELVARRPRARPRAPRGSRRRT